MLAAQGAGLGSFGYDPQGRVCPSKNQNWKRTSAASLFLLWFSQSDSRAKFIIRIDEIYAGCFEGLLDSSKSSHIA